MQFPLSPFLPQHTISTVSGYFLPLKWRQQENPTVGQYVYVSKYWDTAGVYDGQSAVNNKWAYIGILLVCMLDRAQWKICEHILGYCWCVCWTERREQYVSIYWDTAGVYVRQSAVNNMWAYTGILLVCMLDRAQCAGIEIIIPGMIKVRTYIHT